MHTDKGMQTHTHTYRADHCSLMSEEPKWASPPEAKAASASVQRDTCRNHAGNQLKSVSFKAVEVERIRGLKGRGGEVKGTKSGSHLTATLTIRWGKHLKGRSEGEPCNRADMTSWQRRTVKRLKQRHLFNLSLSLRVLVENSQCSSFLKC